MFRYFNHSLIFLYSNSYGDYYIKCLNSYIWRNPLDVTRTVNVEPSWKIKILNHLKPFYFKLQPDCPSVNYAYFVNIIWPGAYNSPLLLLGASVCECFVWKMGKQSESIWYKQSEIYLTKTDHQIKSRNFYWSTFGLLLLTM